MILSSCMLASMQDRVTSPLGSSSPDFIQTLKRLSRPLRQTEASSLQTARFHWEHQWQWYPTVSATMVIFKITHPVCLDMTRRARVTFVWQTGVLKTALSIASKVVAYKPYHNFFHRPPIFTSRTSNESSENSLSPRTLFIIIVTEFLVQNVRFLKVMISLFWPLSRPNEHICE